MMTLFMLILLNDFFSNKENLLIHLISLYRYYVFITSLQSSTVLLIQLPVNIKICNLKTLEELLNNAQQLQQSRVLSASVLCRQAAPTVSTGC